MSQETSSSSSSSSRFRNPLARLTLAGSREYMVKAAERSAEAITDALDTYRKAAQEPGGALKRVALREEFTIVLDTSARMLYLAVALLVLYGVITAVGWYGSSASAVGSLLFVGAAALLVVLIVHTMLFFFARSDQKVHSQVVAFNIGQTIATRLLGVAKMRDLMRALVEFQGEFLGSASMAAAAAGSQAAPNEDREAAQRATTARDEIEDFLKRMANEQPLELFGLHKIKSKKRRVRWLSGALLLGVLTAGAVAIGLSVATGLGVLGVRTLGGEQLALDDVAASGDGGASWSRAAAGNNEVSGDAWLSPQADVFHAPFGARSDFGGLVVLDGGNAVLLAGGAAPQGKDARSRAAYADVWRGERVDGRGWVAWRVQSRAAPWGRRWGHQVVRAGGRLVLVGGVNGATGEVMKDVWTSDDEGVSWSRVDAGFPGRARYHHAMVAAPKQGVDGEYLIVLVGGVTGGAEKIAGEVWWSQGTAATIGTSWSSVGDAPNQPFGEREAPALAAVGSVARIAATQAEELLKRIPADADRTVDGTVLGAAQLQQLPSFAYDRIMALVEARAASMRAKWDGGNANAPTLNSLLGRTLAAGLAAGGRARGKRAKLAKRSRGERAPRRAGAEEGEEAPPAEETTPPPAETTPPPAETTPPPPPSGPVMATDAQKVQINAMLGTSRAITTASHLAAMTAAHAAVLLGDDTSEGDLGRKNLRDGISALWKASRVGVLLLAGGPAGKADRAREVRAPLEVFSSADGGVSWSRVPIPDGSRMPTSRRGHALVVRETGPNQPQELVLAGGFQTARGRDVGMPLGDVWVSGDAGLSWRRVGSGPGRLEQVSSGPYDVPRRAHFGMAAVTSQGAAVSGTGLLVIGGDATGTPEDERKALGLYGSGQNPERETVPDELGEGAKVQLMAAAAAVVLLVVLLAFMHLRVYRALYRDIPNAYVRTEQAWRESLERVAANPEAFSIPGAYASIGRSVPQALRSASATLRSIRSAAPGTLIR